MRRLLQSVAMVALALLMAIPPALAVDLTDTTWDLGGRSRVWARSVGREFGPASGEVVFGAGTFSVAAIGLDGTWQDQGGRSFSGEIDDADFAEALRQFIENVTGAADATVTAVRVDRMWGHVNGSLDRMKMKLRVKVRFSSAALGIEERGAWIKMRLRGRLVAGTPVVNPD